MVLRNWTAWAVSGLTALTLGSCTAGAGNEEAVASQEWDLRHGGVDKNGCPRHAHRITGTDGDDVLWGTRHGDCILGLGGNDEIHGLGGDDVVIGGDGDDVLYGDDDNDKVAGGSGADTLFGGKGNDLLLGGQGNDVLDGGHGNDWVAGGDCNDHLRGDRGADVLLGEAGNDRIELGKWELVDGGKGVDACKGRHCEVNPSAPACDDDSDCTAPKKCVLSTGVCAADSTDDVCGGGGNEECNDADCDDGDACNGDESCDAGGMCVDGTAPTVDDGNPCTVDSCDAESGVHHDPAAAGSSCSDGNLCNGDETCDGSGSCAAGTPLDPDDGNPCTADVCDPVSGVANVPVAGGTSCSDGDACNGDEICDGAGTCMAGAAPLVDDGNVCTADFCDPSSGVVHDPLPAGVSCGDGDACNGSETCDGAGSCAAGAPAVVDDDNACTVDLCDPSTGVSHTPLPTGSACGGGNVCLSNGTCGQGVCFGRAAGTSCSDGNPCNGAELCDGAGVCNPGTPPSRPPIGC